jgi:hypothetical protein
MGAGGMGAGGMGAGGMGAGGMGAGGMGAGGAGGAVCEPMCAGRVCGPDGCGGTCGPECADEQVCADGQCMRGECPEGTFDCGGDCVDLLSSIEHCGSCDRSCLEDGLDPSMVECNQGDCISLCMDATYWPDADADGYGAPGMAVDGDTCDVPENHVANMDDCADDDPWRNPATAEICDDNFDDNCDGEDEECPETAPLGMNVPNWDCTGAPPQNVYAWARFADGAGYFQDGGCFVFFEGSPDQFFVQRMGIERVNQDPSCEQRNGCVCPSLNGWPSYDRRLYAFTVAGGIDECEPISIRDHAGEDQTVSNHCRKYLYQMHFYDIPYSFVAEGSGTLDRRLDRFPTVEIACAEDAPHRNLPFQSLINAPVQKNPNFSPLRR